MALGEWGELAQIGIHIDDLQQRRAAAKMMGNARRVEELASQLIVAQSERQQVVDRIMARLADAA